MVVPSATGMRKKVFHVRTVTGIWNRMQLSFEILPPYTNIEQVMKESA